MRSSSFSRAQASAGGFVGYLDYADGDPHWRQPKGERKLIEIKDERLWSTEFGGPADWLERTVEHLASHPRAVVTGNVRLRALGLRAVAVPRDLWLPPVGHRWDIVPVVIQDPVWERSFPDVEGSSSRSAIPRRVGTATRAPAAQKEVRPVGPPTSGEPTELIETFRLLDLDPVVVTSSERSEILASFLDWTELRRTRRVIGS